MVLHKDPVHVPHPTGMKVNGILTTRLTIWDGQGHLTEKGYETTISSQSVAVDDTLHLYAGGYLLRQMEGSRHMTSSVPFLC